MRPLKNKIFLTEVAKEKVTEGGIILTKDSVVETTLAVALAVGPDVQYVKIGDKVVADWQKAQICEVDGIQGVVIEEDHIMAVVED